MTIRKQAASLVPGRREGGEGVAMPIGCHNCCSQCTASDAIVGIGENHYNAFVGRQKICHTHAHTHTLTHTHTHTGRQTHAHRRSSKQNLLFVVFTNAPGVGAEPAPIAAEGGGEGEAEVEGERR